MGEAALNEARVETHVAEGADQTDDVVTRAALTEERGVAEERGFARVRGDETGEAFLSGVAAGNDAEKDVATSCIQLHQRAGSTACARVYLHCQDPYS